MQADKVSTWAHLLESLCYGSGNSYNWQDGDWVKYLAGCENATTGGDPFAIVLELPDELGPSKEPLDPSINITEIQNKFNQTIRRNLANNMAVVVRKWYPERRRGFSIEEINTIRPTTQHKVHWQGTHKVTICMWNEQTKTLRDTDTMERGKNFVRATDDIKTFVKHMPLNDFILDAHNTKVCGNVLDLPNLRPESPQWIRWEYIYPADSKDSPEQIFWNQQHRGRRDCAIHDP